MEITGKITTVLPLISGEGRNGQWRSQDFVLETQEQYPRKVCFNLFNDRIDQYPMAVGDAVTVSFDIESREYNGRWYTTIRAWKVEKKVEQPANASADLPQAAVGEERPFAPAATVADPFTTGENSENDASDLPF